MRFGAGDGHPHTARELRDAHADQSEARGLLLVLDVGRAPHLRKGDGGDHFAGLQGRVVQAGEESVGRDLAVGGADRRVERQHAGRIAGGRVGIRDRAADRSHVAHHWIADAAGQLGDRRADTLDFEVVGDGAVRRHRADHEPIAFEADRPQLVERAEVDERLALGQPQPHRLNQALAARQVARIAAGGAGGRGDGRRAFVVEGIHRWVPAQTEADERAARQTRSGVAGISRSRTPRASVSALM